MKTYILSVKREEKKGPVICSADSYVTFICRTKKLDHNCLFSMRGASVKQWPTFIPVTDGD